MDKLEDDDESRAVISYMERSHKDCFFCGESLLSLTLKKLCQVKHKPENYTWFLSSINMSKRHPWNVRLYPLIFRGLILMIYRLWWNPDNNWKDDEGSSNIRWLSESGGGMIFVSFTHVPMVMSTFWMADPVPHIPVYPDSHRNWVNKSATVRL